MSQLLATVTESDQEVFVFTLKDAQKIQMQGISRGTQSRLSVENRGARSLCCGAQQPRAPALSQTRRSGSGGVGKDGVSWTMALSLSVQSRK